MTTPPREPWFHIARWVVLPAARAYFSWRFEDLDKVPRTGPALIACNHASYLDPIACSYAVIRAGRRPRFLSKIEMFGVPIIGRVMRGARQIPVRRGTRDQTPLLRAQEALEAGEVVMIYPEGTVTKREDGLPMTGKTGVIRLALTTGVPVTPLATWGSAPVWQKSGPGNLRPRRPVWVKVGDPLDFSAHRDHLGNPEVLRLLTQQVMDALTVLATDLRDRYPERWAGQPPPPAG
jgi:1-acyl-sn-glycerol-3-phosphate acyltransferase